MMRSDPIPGHSPAAQTFDWNAEFPVLRDSIFFNHASVSPLPARAARALRAFADEAEREGGAAWPRWAARLKTARLAAARLLDVDSETIGFVHNTTHGLLCVANSLPWRPGDNIITAEYEFPANVYPWKHLAARGVALRAVPERPDHSFAVDDFVARIDKRTRMIALSLVQYASGFRMPVEPLAEICRRRGIWLCLDAIQALGAVPLRAADLGCDFLVADGHKWLLAPEGAGILYVNPERIELLDDSMTGWCGRVRPWDYDDTDQPLRPGAARFEEGSCNMAGLLAFGESLALLHEIGLPQIWRNIEALTERLADSLLRLGFTIESPRGTGQRSGILAVSRPGFDPEAAVRSLAARNIHAVARRGWLRFSPHGYNQIDQADAVMSAMEILMNAMNA